MHLDLQERHTHPNGTIHSVSYLLGSFHTATRQIHNVIMDEFGDRSITETLDTGSMSVDETELEDRHSTHTERIDLDEFPWAGGSLGELENAQPALATHISCKPSTSWLQWVTLVRWADLIITGSDWRLKDHQQTFCCVCYLWEGFLGYIFIYSGSVVIKQLR